MTYPVYKIEGSALLCFQSNTKMYYIHPDGTNTNPGIAIDHYITTKMVLRYIRWGEEITEAEFMVLYRKLFETVLQKIILP